MATLGIPSMATTATATLGQLSPISAASSIMNSNKYILGIMIILINIGARYISSELTEFQHKVLNHKFARRLLIFIVIWMGTRDIIVALILTATFIILVNGLFNENSMFSIIPKSQNDTNITKEDYETAKQVIEKYEKKNKIDNYLIKNIQSDNIVQHNILQNKNIENNINDKKYNIQPLQSNKKLELFNPRLFY